MSRAAWSVCDSTAQAESGLPISVTGGSQPHALLQPARPFCWKEVQEVSAGLASSLWKGDMPGQLAAPWVITTRLGRATLKGGAVWLRCAQEPTPLPVL